MYLAARTCCAAGRRQMSTLAAWADSSTTPPSTAPLAVQVMGRCGMRQTRVGWCCMKASQLCASSCASLPPCVHGVRQVSLTKQPERDGQ